MLETLPTDRVVVVRLVILAVGAVKLEMIVVWNWLLVVHAACVMLRLAAMFKKPSHWTFPVKVEEDETAKVPLVDVFLSAFLPVPVWESLPVPPGVKSVLEFMVITDMRLVPELILWSILPVGWRKKGLYLHSN